MKNTKFSKEKSVADKEVPSQLKMRLALTTHRYRQTFRQTYGQTDRHTHTPKVRMSKRGFLLENKKCPPGSVDKRLKQV